MPNEVAADVIRPLVLQTPRLAKTHGRPGGREGGNGAGGEPAPGGGSFWGQFTQLLAVLPRILRITGSEPSGRPGWPSGKIGRPPAGSGSSRPPRAWVLCSARRRPGVPGRCRSLSGDDKRDRRELRANPGGRGPAWCHDGALRPESAVHRERGPGNHACRQALALLARTPPGSRRGTVRAHLHLAPWSAAQPGAGGRSLGAYIRERLLGERVHHRRTPRRPNIDEKQLAAVLAELGHSRLSSNLNQLARAVNMGTLDLSQDVEQELRDACRAVSAMRDTLIYALGLKSGASA